MVGSKKCFCNEDVGEYKGKDGTIYYKCAVKPDWDKMKKKLQRCKDKKARSRVYKKMMMGCRLNLSSEHYAILDEELLALKPKDHPKCEMHKLMCKVGVSKTEKNKDRSFFACAAAAPDAPCGFFLWADDFFNPLSSDDNTMSSSSDSSDDEEEKGIKKKKEQKKAEKKKQKTKK